MVKTPKATSWLNIEQTMMARVAACPENLIKAKEASEKLGCGEDKYGNNQYICLPNSEKTALLEFCFNGTMGVLEKGFCQITSEGNLIAERCNMFSTGCPREFVKQTELYNYPACQKINAKQRCFTLNPSCPTNDDETDSPSHWFFVMLVLTIIVLLLVLWIQQRQKNIKKHDVYELQNVNIQPKEVEVPPVTSDTHSTTADTPVTMDGDKDIQGPKMENPRRKAEMDLERRLFDAQKRLDTDKISSLKEEIQKLKTFNLARREFEQKQEKPPNQ